MSKKAPAGVSPCSTMDMLQFDMFPKPPAQPSPRAGDAPPLLASMASSERHALQVDEAGEVLVCGGSALQDEGETFVAHLGLGVEWGAPIAAPTPLAANPELGQAHAVAAGSLHSLILSQTGQVWSCGAGWEGPLGHGNEASLCVPTRIPALADVPISMIAAGRAHSLAISADGALYSWGWGKSGQLGHGDRASVHVPRRVEAIAPPLVALQVSTGRLSPCPPYRGVLLPLSSTPCLTWPRLHPDRHAHRSSCRWWPVTRTRSSSVARAMSTPLARRSTASAATAPAAARAWPCLTS